MSYLSLERLGVGYINPPLTFFCNNFFSGINFKVLLHVSVNLYKIHKIHYVPYFVQFIFYLATVQKGSDYSAVYRLKMFKISA